AGPRPPPGSCPAGCGTRCPRSAPAARAAGPSAAGQGRPAPPRPATATRASAWPVPPAFTARGACPNLLPSSRVRSLPRHGRRRLRAPRRGGEVQAEALLGGEADELPVVSEDPAVAGTQLVQHYAPGLVHAQRMLEQVDDFLHRKATRGQVPCED